MTVDHDTKASIAESAQLIFLDPSKLRFLRHGATLRLIVENDCCHLKVSVLRAFPLSEANRFFSVRDAENKEIGLIPDAEGLSDGNRKLVHEELERRYLTPAVKRIISAKER